MSKLSPNKIDFYKYIGTCIIPNDHVKFYNKYVAALRRNQTLYEHLKTLCLDLIRQNVYI